MNDSDRDPSAARAPSRVPGEGGIELEATAGDLQLGRRPEGAPTRSRGRRVATAEQRRTIYAPPEIAPVSGVYNVVDELGNYLGLQVTCHAGRGFPPLPGEEIIYDGQPPRQVAGYSLAYEAAHLVGGPEPEAASTAIYRPGELVPHSGIYGVVDRHGTYLRHQRACVCEHHKAESERERFPSLDYAGPDAYGYVLQFRADHLKPLDE